MCAYVQWEQNFDETVISPISLFSHFYIISVYLQAPSQRLNVVNVIQCVLPWVYRC